VDSSTADSRSAYSHITRLCFHYNISSSSKTGSFEKQHALEH